MNERDTQFTGFANLLFNKLSELGLVAIVDLTNFHDHPERALQLQEEMIALTKQILAHGASCLVKQACEAISDAELDGRLTLDGMMGTIPDMTQWPEEVEYE